MPPNATQPEQMSSRPPDVTSGATDAELLQRFSLKRDEAAFREIVSRHGSVVMGVCIRVLSHREDAEDAFQAAFIVLAKRAARIRKRESLSAWLYGVAYRVSIDLARKRQRTERSLVSEPMRTDDPFAKLEYEFDRQVVDEELQRLPAKLRTPLILYYLSGKTSKEIAEEIGASQGTIDGRIKRGRQQLRVQLTRRGVALSGMLSVVCVSAEHATAAVSQSLIDLTVSAGVAGSAGMPMPDTISTETLHIAGKEMLRMSLLKPLTMTLCVAVMATLGAVCVSAFGGQVGSAKSSGSLDTRLKANDGSTTTVAMAGVMQTKQDKKGGTSGSSSGRTGAEGPGGTGLGSSSGVNSGGSLGSPGGSGLSGRTGAEGPRGAGFGSSSGASSGGGLGSPGGGGLSGGTDAEGPRGAGFGSSGGTGFGSGLGSPNGAGGMSAGLGSADPYVARTQKQLSESVAKNRMQRDRLEKEIEQINKLSEQLRLEGRFAELAALDQKSHQLLISQQRNTLENLQLTTSRLRLQGKHREAADTVIKAESLADSLAIAARRSSLRGLTPAQARMAAAEATRKAHARIEAALAGPAEPISGGDRLKSLLDFVAEVHGFTIVPDRVALKGLQIESLEDIGISEDLQLSNMRLSNALDIVFSQLEGVDEPLDYIIENEVLKVTTRAVAKSHHETRVYDLTGQDEQLTTEELTEVINGVLPDFDENDPTPIRFVGGKKLIVHHNRRAHGKLTNLLWQLKLISDSPPPAEK